MPLPRYIVSVVKDKLTLYINSHHRLIKITLFFFKSWLGHIHSTNSDTSVSKRVKLHVGGSANQKPKKYKNGVQLVAIENSMLFDLYYFSSHLKRHAVLIHK